MARLVFALTLLAGTARAALAHHRFAFQDNDKDEPVACRVHYFKLN